MIDVVSIYEDVAKDSVNFDQNGDQSFYAFNRVSRRAEGRLLDYLTGDLIGIAGPQLNGTQKVKDYISHLIVKLPFQAQGGRMTIPSDYYTYENMYILGSKTEGDCEEGAEGAEQNCNTSIKLLDADKFNKRCNTNIEELRPTLINPIAKRAADGYEFRPYDLGSGVLEYIRYPKYAEIKTKDDPIYMNRVANKETSENYEWGEFAREILIWFITDSFANNTREQALKQFNTLSGKVPTETK